MNPKYWQKARLLILGCCSLGIFFTLGIKLLAKSSIYKFPSNLVLHTWESIKTDNIKYYSTTLEGRREQKKVSSSNLSIKVYYIPNNLLGNKELIRQYQLLESPPENITMIENSEIGYYGLFTKGNSTNLATCVHPEGKTAFTFPQFTNLAHQNIKTRLLPWIFGISDLRDWRCFWVNMSMSLDNITEQEAHDILQTELKTIVSEITQ